eukprot:Sspe_Gene.58371::Locus_32006_Transcript_1_1_Confidence_1.000_Length_1108::g.58371::m.58371
MVFALFERFMSRLFYSPSDSHLTQVRKSIMVVGSLLFLLARLTLTNYTHQPLFAVVVIVLQSLIIASSLLWMLCTRSCTVAMSETYLVFLLLCVLVEDFRTYGLIDVWGVCIVVMDLALLSVCRGHIVSVMCMMSLLYVAFRSVEQAFPLGVYNSLPALSLYNLPNCRKDRSPGVQTILVRLVTVLFDFILTRNFAHKMTSEQERMQRFIVTAESVAEALVQFDLDSAEQVLGEAGEANNLVRPMRQLLCNLALYRPYLPDTLFSSGDDPPVAQALNAPPQGRAAIVFTDIMSSTA